MIFTGECFLFSIQPKMAVFHSSGKDENFQMLTEEHLAMGGSPGEEQFYPELWISLFPPSKVTSVSCLTAT